MQFTTPTEIARKGSKIFTEYDEAIVMKNNKNIGLLFWGELAKALLDSGVVQQIREELWEMNDPETSEMIADYRKNWLWPESWNFSDFMKEYNV